MDRNTLSQKTSSSYGQVMIPEEDEQLRTLGAALGVLDVWESRTGTLSGSWKTQAGSELAEDDRFADPYHISSAAWSAITAGVSHLCCLRDSLFHPTGPNELRVAIHTHGQLTLIRGALENASTAVWLLEADDRAERVLRRLPTDWDERRELDRTRNEVRVESKSRSLEKGDGEESPPSKTMAEHLTALSEIADRAGADKSKVRDRPGYGQIVKAAGAHLPGGAGLAFIVWKACSAIAHGETRGAINYLPKEILGSPTPGVALAKLSGNVQLMSAGGLMAIGTMRKAFEMYAKLAAVPVES
jgi:hypothetical protein